MNEPKNIDLISLDYNDLKENLKIYLKSTSYANTFDFNSEGTAIDMLLGIFTYNNLIWLHYLHALNNESFIDSAQKTSSLVKLLQTNGFTANRYKSSTCLVSFSKTNSSVAEIDRFAVIQNKNSSNNLVNFYYVGPRTTVDISTTLEFYSGSKLVKNLIPTIDYDNQEIELSDSNIDIRTIVININDEYWTNYTNQPIIGTNETSKIFFTVNKGSKIFVKFGKNIQSSDLTIGKSVSSTDTVRVSYVVSNGEKGNNTTFNSISQFVQNGSLNVPSVSVSSNTSSGGYSEIDNEYLKYISPRSYGYSSLVTKSDFEYVIANSGLLPTITEIDQRISVFDGQEYNDRYGTVYFSIIDLGVTSSEVSSLIQLLKAKMIVGLNLEYIESQDFIGKIALSCKLDTRKTSNTKANLQSQITNSITDTYANKLFFNDISKSALINICVGLDSNISISDSNITILFDKTIDLSSQKIVRFYNEIESFTTNLITTNLSASQIKFVNSSTEVPELIGFKYIEARNSSNTVVNSKVGIYNSTTGFIQIYDHITSDDSVTFTITPASSSITAINNMAIEYEVDSVIIT